MLDSGLGPQIGADEEFMRRLARIVADFQALIRDDTKPYGDTLGDAIRAHPAKFGEERHPAVYLAIMPILAIAIGPFDITEQLRFGATADGWPTVMPKAVAGPASGRVYSERGRRWACDMMNLIYGFTLGAQATQDALSYLARADTPDPLLDVDADPRDDDHST